jgi:tripartite-type tricarboxylate transporter receptor subunit TctC
MMRKCKIGGWFVLIFALLPIFLTLSFAQEKFPSRPITFLVPYPPGGTVDTSLRALTETAAKVLGQPMICVNKPGASGTLAPASLKTVKPDGYTLSAGFPNLLITPHMEDVAFDPLKDFTYIIGTHCTTIGIIVRADAPWKTLKDLVEYARQHPNEIKYSTSTPGGVHHFAMEEIAIREKIKWQMVPYPGSAGATTALLGGHVQVSSQASAWASLAFSGKIRVLAFLGAERNKYLPNVPTLKELGYTPWTSPVGVIGPANMDKRIVNILHDAFKKAMDSSLFVKTLEAMIIDPYYMSTAQYDRYMRESFPQFKEAVYMVGLEKKK